MANIQQLLNEEIRRLARKEVISVEKELKSQLVELRKTVSTLLNTLPKVLILLKGCFSFLQVFSFPTRI